MSEDQSSVSIMTDNHTGNDLDQLRNILFGSQARAMEQHFLDLEKRLDTLGDSLGKQIRLLRESTASDLTAIRQELDIQLNHQKDIQSANHAAIQSRIDVLTADFNQQIDTIQQNLRDFQKEAHQRDDALQQEMMVLGTMLQTKKAGRAELADLFIQMGQQLQGYLQDPAASATDDH